MASSSDQTCQTKTLQPTFLFSLCCTTNLNLGQLVTVLALSQRYQQYKQYTAKHLMKQLTTFTPRSKKLVHREEGFSVHRKENGSVAELRH